VTADPTTDTPARFVVGVDLGTTNSAVAYVDTDGARWRVRDFPVPQLVAPGEVEAGPTLPSFHYEPAAGELPAGALRLPWDGAGGDPGHAVGAFARDHGAAVLGRLVDRFGQPLVIGPAGVVSALLMAGLALAVIDLRLPARPGGTVQYRIADPLLAGAAIIALVALVMAAIFGFVFVVFGAVMQAGIARGVLAITNGHRLELATMFRFENIVTVIVAGLLVGVATGVGVLLCVLPGLIVAFLSQFYVWFIVDKRLGAVDAIKASFRLISNNVGAMIVFFLATMLAYLVGALLCGVGLLAAVPVIYIAQGYTYRRLQGEQVAA